MITLPTLVRLEQVGHLLKDSNPKLHIIAAHEKNAAQRH
jgi:hypothetical protein